MARTADRKLYLGPRLRVLRRELGINQTRMAEELGVSPSYLNHLERNQRPMSAQMLLRLADSYDIDVRAFVAGDPGGAANELSEIMSDALVRDIGVARDEILDVAENYPGIGEAIARFYRALTDLRRLPDQLRTDPGAPAPLTAPLDWLRETIARAHNHFPDLDLAAERLAREMDEDPALLQARIQARLREAHGIRVQLAPTDMLAGTLRHFDMHRRRLLLSERLAASGRLFALAYQLCAQELAADIAAQVTRMTPPDEDSRRLAAIALTNQAAAALLMPYDRFHAAAEQSGYDLPLLRARFGVSAEQLAHRLTSLNRSGARGIPFFMVKIDRAGLLSKRYEADAYSFARFGGTCPRWNALTASDPERVRGQLIETLDGRRFVTLAMALPRAPSPDAQGRQVVAIGCEAKYAPRLFHFADLDVERAPAVQVGPTCHLCDRPACPDRALPPATRALDLHGYERSASPYPFRRV